MVQLQKKWRQVLLKKKNSNGGQLPYFAILCELLISICDCQHHPHALCQHKILTVTAILIIREIFNYLLILEIN